MKRKKTIAARHHIRLSKYRIKKIRKTVKRILIVYWGMFGDCLISTPLIEAVHRNFRRAHITYILGRGSSLSQNASRLLERNPNIDKYINSSMSILSDVLMEKPFDLVIDLCGRTTSQLICKLSGAKIKLWGRFREIPDHFFYADRLNGKWTDPLKVDIDPHFYRADVLSKPAEVLGFKPKEGMVPKIYLSKKERRISKKYLRGFKSNNKDIIIAIHPGGRDPTRLWKTINYSLLADRLIEKYNAKILVFYAPREKHFADRVCKFSNNTLFKVYKKNVREYASIISECDLFISSDGGPLQIALASETPSVGIFKFKSDTNVAHWYDYRKRRGLFYMFVRPAKYLKKNIDSKNIYKRDREEVRRAMKKAEEALEFKENERNKI